MKKSRVSIGQIRRLQIVEAAVAIIHERGIENLSLSAIEKKTEMSRGQLTYYFKTKEEILLAVFDHMIEQMRLRAEEREDNPLSLAHKKQGWERMQSFLTLFVLTPPRDPAFHSLTYTFLAQMLHREDFRGRLAGLFEEWRGIVASDAEVELAGQPGVKVSARTFASLVQAILHGLSVQRNAASDAFDAQEMLQLILVLLGSYLKPGESLASNSQPIEGQKKTRTGRKRTKPPISEQVKPK